MLFPYMAVAIPIIRTGWNAPFLNLKVVKGSPFDTTPKDKSINFVVMSYQSKPKPRGAGVAGSNLGFKVSMWSFEEGILYSKG